MATKSLRAETDRTGGPGGGRLLCMTTVDTSMKWDDMRVLEGDGTVCSKLANE